MKKIFLAALVAAALAVPLRVKASLLPVLIISEVNWGGSALSNADEWLELTNLGEEAIDLTGYSIAGAGTSGQTLSLPDGAVIEPYSTYVIANYDQQNSTLAFEPSHITSQLSLSNSGLLLVLYDQSGAEVDAAGSGGPPPAGRSVSDGAASSMIRIGQALHGSLPEAWAESASSMNFDEGVNQFGSPGVIDYAFVEEEPLPEEEEVPPEEEPEPLAYPEGTLIINEFMSDPFEGKEWVEIYNPSENSIPLEGWKMQEAGGTSVALEGDAGPNGFAVAEFSNRLNNSGDLIELLDPSGNVIDSIAYGDFEGATAPVHEDPDSVARDTDGTFVVTTTPTKGSANEITDVVLEEEDPPAEEEPPVEEEDPPAEEEPPVEEEEPEPPAYSVGTLIINEFMSDPFEGKEWVEIYNPSENSIPLEGWKVTEAGGTSVALEGEVGPSGFAIAEFSNRLNNAGDLIELVDPSGNVTDSIAYGDYEGATIPNHNDPNSVARNSDNTFVVTTSPTKGAANVITHVDLEENVEEEEPQVVEEAPPAEEATPEPLSYAVRTLIINEFVSDPFEGKEWVEVFNPSGDSISLEGWKVTEAGGTSVALADDIGSQAYAVAEFSSRLNNSGDLIELIDPSGNVIDSIAYGDYEGATAPNHDDPNSVARNSDNTFVATTSPTKGAENVITLEATEEEEAQGDQTEPEASTGDQTDEETTSNNEQTTGIDEATGTTSVTQPLNDSTTSESTDTTSDTSESSETSETSTQCPTALRIVELYPNPEGDETAGEYIVIQNTGSETVDLGGCKLMDLSKSYELTGTLGQGQTLTLKRTDTNIALNNTQSETVVLVSREGDIIDTVMYDKAEEGSVYAYLDEGWVWTGVFEGAESADVPKDGNQSGTASKTASSGSTSVKTAVKKTGSSSSSGTSSSKSSKLTVVEGTVIALPGTFGSQIMYIDGRQIYSYYETFPALVIGNVVRVTGEPTTNHGEPRLKITSADAIVVLGMGAAEPAVVAIKDLNETYVGKLIQVHGVVIERSGDRFTLLGEDAELQVILKEGAAISASSIDVGDELFVTGVLSTYDGSLRLLPRSQDDVRENVPDAAITTAGAETDSGANPAAVGLVLAGATALAVLGKAVHFRRKKNHARLAAVPVGA